MNPSTATSDRITTHSSSDCGGSNVSKIHPQTAVLVSTSSTTYHREGHTIFKKDVFNNSSFGEATCGCFGCHTEHSPIDRKEENEKQLSSLPISEQVTRHISTHSTTTTATTHSTTLITAPPMTEKGKEFCLMLIDRLLEESDLKIKSLHSKGGVGHLNEDASCQSNIKFKSLHSKGGEDASCQSNIQDPLNNISRCCCCCDNKESISNQWMSTITREHWPQYITICGIGSLMSEKSAKRTFPELHNFRKVIVKGHLRTFNLVAISSLPFGDLEKRKVASVAAASYDEVDDKVCQKIIERQQKHYEKIGNLKKRQQIQRAQDIEMYCTAFEVPLSEEIWYAFMTREHRYRLKFVTLDQEFKNNTFVTSCYCARGTCGIFTDKDHSCGCCNCSVTFQNQLVSCGCKALMCCQYNDDLYKTERCVTYENEYHERVARHYSGRIWYHTKDVYLERQECTTTCPTIINETSVTSHSKPNMEIPIKPISKYLDLCLNAALELGPDVLQNFMYTSILADGQTLMEDYVKTEEPELYEKYSKYYYYM
ncbi:hypothetical protein FDP41_000307 [Naegleria fowleri]|uniref:Uncharacterized protein n=1 Tax=Naegleria fowleri TaxID=5763 RepID=A0A6A5CGF6_NAEFO|nr:uncharacterized protein FDP41_000307 [Naegleria fowleri]KAF0984408.1 hypothetical protein FDP41_000307 [Naegleria fowleri]